MSLFFLLALLCSGLTVFAESKPVALSNAEGQALAAELRAQKPAEQSSVSGTLKIRDPKGKRREIAINTAIIPGAESWQAVYETKITNGVPHVKLVVIHAETKPNQYVLTVETNSSSNAPQKLILTGNEAMIPFAGSDFWLADLGLEFLHWPEQKLLRKEIKRSQGCRVLESTNPQGGTNGYVRVVSWIHNETGGIVQAEAYDAANKLIKTFAPKAFDKVNGQYQLKEMEIRNERLNSRTQLEFDLTTTVGVDSTDVPLTPIIKGDWWQVAGDPDLGELTDPAQQPVDFGIWQAADGTWQLWSCIRKTKESGNTRLFHRWEGAKLTDTNWKPLGIAMRADATFGETPGGLQAPFVFKSDGKFLMAYGNWESICLATSDDGKQFTRRLNAEHRSGMFGEVKGSNTRDPMVLRIGDTWFCYYTAYPNKIGSDYCRTSKDTVNWSEPHKVASGGRSGSGPYSAECPYVVELTPGHYYLFRTQHYGKDAQTNVYYSTNPLDFGVDNDEGHFITSLPVAAPEIIQSENGFYIAALLPNLKGIQIARLQWVTTDAAK